DHQQAGEDPLPEGCHRGAQGLGPEASGLLDGVVALSALLVPELSAGVPEAAVSAGLSAGLPAAGAGAEEPLRKSVTYQPEPLSWKPAAVSCLVKAAAPQAGQSVSGASDIFCRTSLAWPQD